MSMFEVMELFERHLKKKSSIPKEPKKPTLNDGILELYDSVIKLYGAGFVICRNNVLKAVKRMDRNYKYNAKWKRMEEYDDTNFRSPSYRWVYLFKYAKCHTGLTHKLLYDALFEDKILRDKIDVKRRLNLCSLGGGPGCDIVAILHAFTRFFGAFECSVSVIDNAMEWQRVFAYIVEELREGKLGKVKDVVSKEQFQYEYVKGNLLWDLNNYPDVKQRVIDADFISMVRFVSASACWRTPAMLREIFSCMKPGALVMYLDNSDGKFLKEVKDAALECGLQSEYGPILCFKYEVDSFKKKQLGCETAYKAKVSFQIWQKPENHEAIYVPRKRRRTGSSRKSGASESDTSVRSKRKDSSSKSHKISDKEIELPRKRNRKRNRVLHSIMEVDDTPASKNMFASHDEQTFSIESSAQSSSFDSEKLSPCENFSGTDDLWTSINVGESSLSSITPDIVLGSDQATSVSISETGTNSAPSNIPEPEKATINICASPQVDNNPELDSTTSADISVTTASLSNLYISKHEEISTLASTQQQDRVLQSVNDTEPGRLLTSEPILKLETAVCSTSELSGLLTPTIRQEPEVALSLKSVQGAEIGQAEKNEESNEWLTHISTPHTDHPPMPLADSELNSPLICNTPEIEQEPQPFVISESDEQHTSDASEDSKNGTKPDENQKSSCKIS